MYSLTHPSILSSRVFNLDLNGVPDKTTTLNVHGNSAAPHYPLGGNELPGGYQEKLAIINALTNTVSVRSDVFTVYFVIHGYTPDDLGATVYHLLGLDPAAEFVDREGRPQRLNSGQVIEPLFTG